MTAPQLTHAERLALFQQQQRYRKRRQFGSPSAPVTAGQPSEAEMLQGHPPRAPTSRIPTFGQPQQAAADQTVRLRLRVLSGPDAGAEFELPQGEFVIGRGHDADLILTDDTVSHHHAKIVVGERRATIEDLRSLNGTQLGGISLRGVAILSPGNRVTVAETELGVEAGDQRE